MTMGKGFEKVLKLIRDKLGEQWAFDQGDREGRPERQGLLIVRGVRCTSLGDAIVDLGRMQTGDVVVPLPQGINFNGHAAAMGVLHALDVIVGNYDRLQFPNFANFFLDEVGGLIAIDVDSLLVSMHHNPNLWHATWRGGLGRDDIQMPTQAMMQQWPKMPMIPLVAFEAYTQNATMALQRDFDYLIGKAKLRDSTPAKRWCSVMPGHRATFVNAAVLTFRWLKANRNDLEWFPEVSLCSRASLKDKISSVMC
jgi:hypothetical protein